MENSNNNDMGNEIYLEHDCMPEHNDCLNNLAEDYGIATQDILDANPEMDQDPEIAIPVQVRIPRRIRGCRNGTFYTIRRGDNLFRLAREFNTTVEEIQRANPGINLFRLRIGTVICIPGRRRIGRFPGPMPRPFPEPGPFPGGPGHGPGPGSGRVYTVQVGDTIFSIARRFNTSVGELMRLNPGLNPERLVVGQQIRIA